MHIFVTANYRDAFMFFAFFLGGQNLKVEKLQFILTVQWFSEFSLNKLSWRYGFMIFWMFNATNYRDVFLQYSFFSSCFSFLSFSFSFSLFLSIRHFVPYWITSLRSWFQKNSASLRRFAAYLSTLLRSWFHKSAC